MLSMIERTEIINRTRGMNDDELEYTLKAIPTSILLAEIGRRDGVILDKLSAVCAVWNDITIDVPFDQMDILQKEELLKRMRRALYGE